MNYENARRICFFLSAIILACVVIGIIVKSIYLLIPIALMAVIIGIIANKYFRCPHCGARIPDKLNYKPYKRCIRCGERLI